MSLLAPLRVSAIPCSPFHRLSSSEESDIKMYSVYRNTPSMLSFSSAESSNLSTPSLLRYSPVNSPSLSTPPTNGQWGSPGPTGDPAPTLPVTSPNGILTVLDYTPRHGEAGSRITATIGFRQIPGRVIGLRLVFSGQPLRTHVAHGQSRGQWQLRSEVPSLNSGIANTTHTLQIEALEGGGVADSVEFGTFTYWEPGTAPIPSPPPQSIPGPARRVRSFDQRIGSRHSPLHSRHPSHASSHNTGSLTATLAAATLSAPSLPMTPMSTSPNSSTSSLRPRLAQPSEPYRIVRRTEIPIEREPSAMQVVMNIHGDLRSMAVGWAEEEVKSRRRLVQFWRHTEGPVVNVHFCPIKPEEYDDSQIVVSCIYREDVDKCYITSFDLIRLLEGIIGSVCNIDEKNRIRRNVHHIEHDTISKSKPYHEEFFDLIMAFPAPMPRRNVRDLKAFRWDYLGEALHAIIDKMALDYNPTPISEMVEPSIPEVPEPEPDRFVTYAPPIQTDVSDYHSQADYTDSIYDFRSPSSTTSVYETFNSPNHSISSFSHHHLHSQGHLSPNGSSTSFQFAQNAAASVSSFNINLTHSPNASTPGFQMAHQSPHQSSMSYSSPMSHEDPYRFGGMSIASTSSLDGALGSEPIAGGGHYNQNGFWIRPSQ